MKLSTSLVSVKRISAKINRSNFSNEKLEQSAKAIVEAEGIISPLILQQTGINIYEVVAGDFEYHAAARAREIDPRKAEMIEAYILNEENEKAILEQVELLRKSTSISSDTEVESSTASPSWDRVDNLEARLESVLKEIKQEIKQNQREQQTYIGEKFAEFADRLPKPINVLEVFNKASAVELVDRLEQANITGKKANDIVAVVELERNKQEFCSLKDISNRVVTSSKRTKTGKQKLISESTMIKIIDRW